MRGPGDLNSKTMNRMGFRIDWMRRGFHARCLASLLLLCFIGFVSTSQADVVLDWNGLMIEAVRADNSGPTLSSRNLAILHAAIYDTVNSITRTHRAYQFQLKAPEQALAEAAVTGAACEVMNSLYRPFRSKSENLCARIRSVAPATAAVWKESFDFGARLGKLALQARAADGAMAETPYIPQVAAGQWRRTPPYFRPPLAPHWGNVSPFCLPDLGSFLPPPPPSLDSVEYATAISEVKLLGRKSGGIRTEEQTRIAIFWSDFSYTSMPPGHWHLIAAGICRERGCSVEKTARLFALLSLAQADAGIVCWDAKYRYNFWRPVTAIRAASGAMEADKNWESLLAAPPFPAYTSGHSCFSAASAAVLRSFFGTDKIHFTVTSDSLPGETRTFESLSACADEVGMSRIYGGIHFAFDHENGKNRGRRIGDYVADHCLRPVALDGNLTMEVKRGTVEQGMTAAR
jgi:hypothetical protein